MVLASPLSTGATASAPAITSTACAALPTCSTTFDSVNFAPWLNAKSFSCHGLNPGAEIETVYEPGCTALMLKKPLEFVIVWRVSPEASFFMTTFALGTTAPVAS